MSECTCQYEEATRWIDSTGVIHNRRCPVRKQAKPVYVLRKHKAFYQAAP